MCNILLYRSKLLREKKEHIKQMKKLTSNRLSFNDKVFNIQKNILSNGDIVITDNSIYLNSQNSDYNK